MDVIDRQRLVTPYKKGGNMKTAQEIISLLEAELAEAYELHDKAKGKDAQESLLYMIKATVILHLLEEIKGS